MNCACIWRGYLTSLRHSDAIEPYLINQLEQAALRYLLDSSNFAMPEPEPDLELLLGTLHGNTP
jgi:hypothetical protein